MPRLSKRTKNARRATNAKRAKLYISETDSEKSECHDREQYINLQEQEFWEATECEQDISWNDDNLDSEKALFKLLHLKTHDWPRAEQQLGSTLHIGSDNGMEIGGRSCQCSRMRCEMSTVEPP
jgi:hypothetical protein